MLPCVMRCQAASLKNPAICTTIRLYSFDPLEAKMRQKKEESLRPHEAGEVDEQRVKYATKTDFKHDVQDARFQGATDAENGQIPTNMQKRFLVITKLYPSKDAIPQYVHNGTMNRMHDRMRVVFIITAVTFFFFTFLIGEKMMDRKIIRDRNAGVVVTKM